MRENLRVVGISVRVLVGRVSCYGACLHPPPRQNGPTCENMQWSNNGDYPGARIAKICAPPKSYYGFMPVPGYDSLEHARNDYSINNFYINPCIFSRFSHAPVAAHD